MLLDRKKIDPLFTTTKHGSVVGLNFTSNRWFRNSRATTDNDRLHFPFHLGGGGIPTVSAAQWQRFCWYISYGLKPPTDQRIDSIRSFLPLLLLCFIIWHQWSPQPHLPTSLCCKYPKSACVRAPVLICRKLMKKIWKTFLHENKFNLTWSNLPQNISIFWQVAMGEEWFFVDLFMDSRVLPFCCNLARVILSRSGNLLLFYTSHFQEFAGELLMSASSAVANAPCLANHFVRFFLKKNQAVFSPKCWGKKMICTFFLWLIYGKCRKSTGGTSARTKGANNWKRSHTPMMIFCRSNPFSAE